MDQGVPLLVQGTEPRAKIVNLRTCRDMVFVVHRTELVYERAKTKAREKYVDHDVIRLRLAPNGLTKSLLHCGMPYD